LQGLDDLPRADATLRKELEAEAAARGWPALHAELATVDPITAARLAPNDSQRIGRALEIFRLTGTPMSALLDRAQSELPYRVLQLALIPSDRAVLHQRIAARFDAMLADGLIDEVKSLRQTTALNPDLPAMRAVGYRQAWAFLDGEIDLGELREQGIAATRQLAKRQLTWAALMARCGGAGLSGGRSGSAGVCFGGASFDGLGLSLRGAKQRGNPECLLDQSAGLPRSARNDERVSLNPCPSTRPGRGPARDGSGCRACRPI
jgi:hypothetical protein